MGRVKAQIRECRLDPILPAALSRYLTPQDWEDLRVAIAKAVAPAVDHNNCFRTFTVCFLVLFFIFFLAIPLTVSSGDGDAAAFFCIITFLSVPTVAIIQIIIACHGITSLRPRVDENVQRVLREFSSKRSGMTFHLIEDDLPMMGLYVRGVGGYGRNQINVSYVLEISIDEEAAAYRLTTVKGVLVTDDNNEHEKGSEQETIKVRLKNLDNINHLISEDEYSRKRQEIMNMI